METSTVDLKSTFDTAVPSEPISCSSSPRTPRCNEQHVSLNFKLSPNLTTALDAADATKSNEGDEFYDSEKLKSELLLKADEFFNSGCIKVEQLKNEISSVAQIILPKDEETNEQECENIDAEKTEKGVSINIDGEFDVLLEHIEGLNTAKIAHEMWGLKLCSNFDTSSKAIVVNTLENLGKILNMPGFDPHAPPVKFKIKRALSLHELSHREDNIITLNIPMESVDEYMKSKEFNPLNESLNVLAKHEKDEFCTFCSCSECLSYREVVVHIMLEQFKASHMVVLLLDALLKAYSPLLRNDYALQHFEKLLEINKDVYWLATGLIYNKKYEELDFIYDETLTDPMILVLFSSILMINSPMQLLQILAFHVSCVVEAFAFGISEDSVEEKLIYILDGFDLFSDISDQIASYFVIFERNFLSKFSLTWIWLCQRLFQKHVYVRFFVAITNCGESLKNDDPLKQRYSEFVKRMLYLDMYWSKIIWPKLQKFNLTEAESNRRSAMIVIHKLFDGLIEDALRLPIQGDSDENVFEDLQLKDRRLLWQNILAFAKMKWPNGFCNEPNILVYDYRCEKCDSVCIQHERGCKCVTCAIGGTPILQAKNNLCKECVSKEEDTKKNNTIEETEEREEQIETLYLKPNTIEGKCQREIKKIIATSSTSNVVQNGYGKLEPEDFYHIAWAVFKHFTQRKLYVRDKIEEQFFCKDCKFPACMLARRIINNEIAPELTTILLSHYHPLPMLQSELRGIFPDIFFFNPRMFASHHDSSLHNTVVKAYWTFIISVFGTFFVDFEKPCPLNLNVLELGNSDVKIAVDKIKGNPDDTIFLEFLETIRSSSPTDTSNEIAQNSVQNSQGHKKLDEFLKPTKRGNLNSKIPLRISADSLRTPSTAIDTGDIDNDAVTVQPTSSNLVPGDCDGTQQRRSCTPKSKKCCLEHAADFGAEHCRENHARKRLKKDCNHARVNETRDRLRKKLQDVKKNQQQMQTQNYQQQQQAQQHQQPPQQHQQQLNSPQKLLKNHSAMSLAAASSIDNDITMHTAAAARKLTPMSPATTPVTGTNTPQSIDNIDDSEQVIGKVMEICDMLDNNKQKMKKWLDETLTYIEGYASSTTPTSATNKKLQPQTKDPKKAAKKAKQKMRKEEEKRIGELHEIRDQFQDIYFKEFLEKIELKTLKSGGNNNGGVANGSSNAKRRCDKKKIADVEANIKKLQRAKAKLESNILELIATVKQTNTEFKFPYLPTKEQQQAKLQELAETSSKSGSGEATPTLAPEPPIAQINVAADVNNYTYMPPLPKFYPNISFPYEMSFPGSAAPPPPYGLVSHQTLPTAYGNTTNCYSPPQQQTLSPNVMTALAANEKSVNNANCSDPSKRIVTIRRVHNPDMPDSQVTVTARGGSHGKEKLLYRFVNGTMVPTTANFNESQPINKPTILTAPNVSAAASSTTTGATNAPQLSKSQLKKERRRLAKLEKLAQDLAISDCEEDEPMPPPPLPPPTKQQSSKNAKESKIDKSKKKTLIKGYSEDSTTSSQSGKKQNITTKNENANEIQELPNTKKNKKKLQQQKAEELNQQKVTENSKSLKAQKKQEKKKIKEKAEEEKEKEEEEVEVSSNDNLAIESFNIRTKNMKTQPKEKYERTKTKSKTSKVIEKETTKTLEKEIIETEKIKSTIEKQNKKAAKQQRQRRQKLINHGQFDNNPYKNLHMQDSDTELEVTASSCDETEEEEVEEEEEESEVRIETVAEKPSKTAKEEKESIKKEKGKSGAINKPTTTTTPNRTKATQTVMLEPTKNNNKDNGKIKIQKQQQQQQQHKIENMEERSRRSQQPEQQQLRKQVSNSRQISNESLRSEKKNSNNNKQSMATQRGNVGNKKQDMATSTTTPLNNARSNIRNTTTNTRVVTKTIYPSNDINNKPPITTTTKRAQRTRKKQTQSHLQQQHQQQHLQHHHPNYTDCGAGIPMRMEYFNPNEVNIPPPTPSMHHQQQQHIANNASAYQQQLHYEQLTRQFQNMQVAAPTVASTARMMQSYASVSGTTTSSAANNNVSIMDQLNRGVQVENLSLPPGITLTKVDPIKSEQLRQKSESIKRLSQPLQTPNLNTGYQQQQQHPHHLQQHLQHHHPHGPTIIAPPTTGYLPVQVGNTNSNIGGGNIIMVEALTSKPSSTTTTPNTAAIAAAAAASNKANSKNKRRRNKGKRSDCSPRDSISTNASSNNEQQQQQQTKMITLRNPMFHGGPTATVLQQPPAPMLPGHHGIAGGSNPAMSMPQSLPMDQPAAIIKNENGMFTIRNPALHQAVTNGLALGGYRQFGGNVNYYTPQEAVAEAAKAQQQQQQQQQLQQKTQQHQQTQSNHGNITHPSESFSYFSNTVSANKSLPNELLSQQPTKTISITCTTIDPKTESDKINQRLENPTPSPIARPTSEQRTVPSAIGSEIKQNRNSANVDHLWSEYRQQRDLSQSHESLPNVSGNSSSNQQTDYFNGYEVFPQRGGGGSSGGGGNSHISHAAHSTPAPNVSRINPTTSTVLTTQLSRSPNSLFEASIADNMSSQQQLSHHHLHHSCGDDSPPPTNLLSYSSKYLDDIPNTGVIRYDDASFLKNLIPGQRLNKEVSIHNINESNFGRSTSPMSHLVEITPVYSVNSNKVSPSPSLDLQIQRQQQQQQHYRQTSSSSSTSAGGVAYVAKPNSFNEFEPTFQNTGSTDQSSSTGSGGSVGSAVHHHHEQTYQPFGYDAFDTSNLSTKQKSITDLNSLFSTNFTTPSSRSSPYLDESFVQNLNTLQISSPEQCAQQQLNGETLKNNGLMGNANNCNTTNSGSWW